MMVEESMPTPTDGNKATTAVNDYSVINENETIASAGCATPMNNFNIASPISRQDQLYPQDYYPEEPEPNQIEQDDLG